MMYETIFSRGQEACQKTDADYKDLTVITGAITIISWNKYCLRLSDEDQLRVEKTDIEEGTVILFQWLRRFLINNSHLENIRRTIHIGC
ncbi:hypothetical protein [Candidatus Coxiella mudrowiae]|uniref:Uncharacterized protein n=1 Tax=Candidatus Coxiella mudrowiae TaxID=2054173 RepID=A0ABN4HPL0_9COXI|nr:hypothetical protein [Candidatus Coxiella mudrowiae]AKQ33637.1 hypothetical protein CleRT_08650 [Candidatus Coxiella mudrowiae]